MSNAYEYEVALSFAGEQRKQVQEIAALLKSRGVTVFFDDYEKVDMWGKNLYDHLSDIYQNKARYCLMFLSKDYADKAWTNLERQNAQVRALFEKGAEYILPVRFDDAIVKGIPATLYYLDYRYEGANGIADAVLQKLGKSLAVPQVTREPLLRNHSPYAFLNVNDGRFAWLRVTKAAWGDEIYIEASGDEETSLLSQLRGERPRVYLAYGFDVAEAKVLSAVREVDLGKVNWKLTFRTQKSDFSDSMEMGTSAITADEFALRRARRILLNEFPSPELTSVSIESMNAAMYENLLRGMNTALSVEKSKIPALYEAMKSDPAEFLEVAWILLVYELKLSATVQTVKRLVLELTGDQLTISFAGLRRKVYSNKEAFSIEINGTLELG